LPVSSWVRNLTDGLVSAFTGLGDPKLDKHASLFPSYTFLDPLMLETLWKGDWVAKKVIQIPAADSTRMWRLWKAERPDIKLLEEAERKIGVQRQLLNAILRARLYGGAAIILGVDDGQNVSKELDLKKVKKDSLKYLHVCTRYELQTGILEGDPSSPWYGRPTWYSANILDPTKTGVEPTKVHPSRVVHLIGTQSMGPQMMGVNQGWGDSVLQNVYDAITASGSTLQNLAHLIQEAKIDVIKTPDLQTQLTGEEAETNFKARWSATNQGKSLFKMIILDKQEDWQRIGVNFAGMPEILDAMFLVTCAAADIPATRFMGQSPRGLNATGESDTRNYYDRIKSDQEQDLSPAINQLDEILIRSALGKRPDEVWYEWRPLWQMDEQDKAANEKTTADAISVLSSTGLIPTVALATAVQNKLIEMGTYPGLEDALAEAEAQGDVVESEPSPEEQMQLRVEEQRQMRLLPPSKKPIEAAGSPASANGLTSQQMFRTDTDLSSRLAKIEDALIRIADANPYHVPAGSSQGGQFTSSGGGGPQGGQFTSNGGGGGASSGGGRENYGLVPGDAEKFKDLKGQWAKVNNELLEHLDRPDGPEAKAKLTELQAICKQIQGLHADPGGPEGIGKPGGPLDVLVVGAGPGGLTAGINGAAEGLDTMVVEANVTPGGQAKFSSRIENFPGFPIGVTGERLTQNMFEQATRLGAQTKLGVRVTGMTYDQDTGLKHVTLSNGEKLDSRTVIMAGGLEFKHMDFPGSDGPGVIVGDGKELARVGAGGRICVIGGSNGAAQAALGAASKCEHVYLLTRSPIVNSMSDYQVVALHNNPKITVIESDSIAKLWRDEHNNPKTVETVGGKSLPVKAVGEFVGSMPDVKWVPSEIQLAKGGKVHTNSEFETGLPGVYAVGDMREGGAGRVGVAVGEGQMALRQANAFLDKQRTKKIGDTFFDEKKPPLVAELPIAELFDLDRENPWFGQTVEDVRPLGKK
jgi:phage-related protein (TIGR01555 family)